MAEENAPVTVNVLKELLQSHTNQINENINKLSNAISYNKTKVDEHEQIIEHQQATILQQQEQISENNEHIKYLEMEVRKRNLVFYNILEIETSDENLKEILVSKLSIVSDVSISMSDIEFLYRLGKKQSNNDNINIKPRPILVGFFSIAKKQTILKLSYKLKPIGVSEDIPRDIADARRSLAPVVKKLREEGKKTYFKIDKLYVNGQPWITENTSHIEESHKRKPESSPEKPEKKRSVQKTGTPTKQIKNVAKKIIKTPSKTRGPSTPSTPTTPRSLKNFPLFQLGKKIPTNTLSPVAGGSSNSKAFEYIRE